MIGRAMVCAFVLLALLTASGQGKPEQAEWLGTWAASPVDAEPVVTKEVTLGAADYTIREIVRISTGGKRMKVTFTNEFGSKPLTISSVHIAIKAAKGSIAPSTDRMIFFGGRPSVTIAAGGFMASDSITFPLPPHSDVVVTFFVPKQELPEVTQHTLARSITYLVPGNHVGEERFDKPVTTTRWLFLKNIQVDAQTTSDAIVTLGDSITDGASSTADENRRWPDVLAGRLGSEEKTNNISVLNEGIAGNRILHTGTGPKALDRLERDVFNAPGVKYVILLEGINDIGHSANPRNADDVIFTQQLIDGMKDIIERTHARGLKIIGATLTPYGGSKNHTDIGEGMRQAVNDFIRTPGNFDGFIDFDKATRDPAHPDQFLPQADSGDHLHPNDAGYEMMGKAIDLNLFVITAGSNAPDTDGPTKQ